jgi:hypothetical protein
LIKNIEKEGGRQIYPESGSNFNSQEHEAINSSTGQKEKSRIKSIELPGWYFKK